MRFIFSFMILIILFPTIVQGKIYSQSIQDDDTGVEVCCGTPGLKTNAKGYLDLVELSYSFDSDTFELTVITTMANSIPDLQTMLLDENITYINFFFNFGVEWNCDITSCETLIVSPEISGTSEGIIFSFKGVESTEFQINGNEIEYTISISNSESSIFTQSKDDAVYTYSTSSEQLMENQTTYHDYIYKSYNKTNEGFLEISSFYIILISISILAIIKGRVKYQ